MKKDTNQQTQPTANGAAMSADEMRRVLSKQEVKTVTRTFEPGITFEVQRVDLAVYVMSGLLPESYYQILCEVQTKDLDQERAREQLQNLTSEEFTAIALMKPRLAVAACVRPKIVTRKPETDDEIALLELPDETLTDICNWVLLGCPGIPVYVAGKEVDVEDINRFRSQGAKQKQTGGKPFTLEPDGEAVQQAAE